MNILLIGGNGFIGSHLVDLLALNNHKIRVFDQFKEKYREPLSGVDYRIFSLSDDDSLFEAMRGIDLVFHLASSTVPSSSNQDILNDVNGNLITSLRILNSAARSKIKKIVYFSSGGAVYGAYDGLLDETLSLNPISSYGIIKGTIEKYFLLFSKIYKIDTIIFRPSNPYGPRQGQFITQGVISTFLKKIALNESLNVYGSGRTLKDYIYIEDLVKICYEITINQKEGIFNVGTGIGTSINQIIDIIKEVTNLFPHVQYKQPQNYDVQQFILDITKAKSVIGDYKFVSLKNGIERTWNWLNRASNNCNLF